MLAYEAKLSPEKKIPLAIVGCGSVARWKHLPALTEGVPELQIVALCDMNEELLHPLADHYRVERRYTSAEAMIADGGFEAVDINAGHIANKALVAKFAEAGIHVFAEKPVAATSDDARAMHEATSKAGIVFQIGHMKRVYYAHRLAMDLIKNQGAVGTPTAIQTRMWWDSEKYPQMLFNNGIHHIDLIQFFMGPARTVFSRISETDSGASVTASIGFDDGKIGSMLMSSFASWEHPNELVEITGDNGHVLSAENGSVLTHYRGDKPAEVYRRTLSAHWVQGNDTGGFIPEFRRFAESILHGKEVLCGGEDGVNSLLLYEAILESVESGSEVEVGK